MDTSAEPPSNRENHIIAGQARQTYKNMAEACRALGVSLPAEFDPNDLESLPIIIALLTVEHRFDRTNVNLLHEQSQINLWDDLRRKQMDKQPCDAIMMEIMDEIERRRHESANPRRTMRSEQRY